MKLTKKEIDNLSNNELDRLLAGNMGWKYLEKAIWYDGVGICYAIQDDGVWKFEHDLARIWSPTTEIHDAWEFMKRVQTIDKYWNPDISWDDDDGDGNPMWVARFSYYGESEEDFRFNEVYNKNECLAISRSGAYCLFLEGTNFYPSPDQEYTPDDYLNSH